MKLKKNILRLVILAIALALLIGALILVSYLFDDEEEPEDTPDVMDGEALYMNNTLILYPKIDKSDIYSIEIRNKNGVDYAFQKTWDKESGSYEIKLKDYEKIEFDPEMYSYLMAYITAPITYDPLRNVSEEKMIEYGVTEDTCDITYTITKENDDGTRDSYTVRIGNEAFSSSVTYYASVEGRDHVYRVQEGLFEYTNKTLLEYMEPTIYQRFSTSSYASLGIEYMTLYSTMLEKQEGNILLNNILHTFVAEKDDEEVYFNMVYNMGEGEQSRITLADMEYLLTVFETLFTTFVGEEVVAINPSDEELGSFGLGEGYNQFLISVGYTDENTYSMILSEEIDGYHYILTPFYDQQTPLLVKVSGESLPFLKQDEASLLKWSATSSVMTGFYEYLEKNTAEGIPGIKEMTIKTTYGYEEFYLDFNEATGKLTVTTKNCGLTFIDADTTDAYEVSQFRNLYTYLIFYPMPYRFNSLSSEEQEEYIKDENIVFELVARRGDGVVLRYTYYKLTSNYAMALYQEGKELGDNTIEWTEPVINFDVKMEHIYKIENAFKTVITGGEIEPDDNIY